MPNISEINSTLNHSETKSMLYGLHDKNSLFSTLPLDVIKKIKYSPSLDPDFLNTLSDAGRGEFNALKAKLDAAKPDKEKLKRLLLKRADVITRSGLLVECTTLLECAFGE